MVDQVKALQERREARLQAERGGAGVIAMLLKREISRQPGDVDAAVERVVRSQNVLARCNGADERERFQVRGQGQPAKWTEEAIRSCARQAFRDAHVISADDFDAAAADINPVVGSPAQFVEMLAGRLDVDRTAYPDVRTGGTRVLVSAERQGQVWAEADPAHAGAYTGLATLLDTVIDAAARGKPRKDLLTMSGWAANEPAFGGDLPIPELTEWMRQANSHTKQGRLGAEDYRGFLQAVAKDVGAWPEMAYEASETPTPMQP